MVIYKKDTKGKIRSLDIYANEGTLYQESGLLNGKKVLNSKVCKAKNVGKSNETTPTQQAIAQVSSKITEKLKEGYFHTIEEAENIEVILPMLAHEHGKHSHKIDWSETVYAQPKLDGMRALGIEKDTFLSRAGNKINTLEHIHKELNILRDSLKGLIPDGELYAHGLSFQENMKLIKKYRPNETEQVCYHVYDLISSHTFAVRNAILEVAFKSNDFKYIKPVQTVIIKNEEELKEFHTINLSKGYEGTIIRHGNVGYKINGRSANLLKYKDFKDTIATIIDVVPTDARPEQGKLICEIEIPGEFPGQFKASLKFSHKEREEILTNKRVYIGQIAEIRYFEETDAGIPRFPVCVGFRLDK